MNLFFADISGTQAILGEEESWHCIKVLRHQAGDAITVIDGRGKRATGTIAQAHPKQCLVTITDQDFFERNRPYHLHVAIAPTKNIDRIEWFVEKAVEIGIDELSFLRCKNSERTVIKADRIHKIIDSAVKQSLQYYRPVLHELVDFRPFIDLPDEGMKLIAHCEADDKKHVKEYIKAGGRYTLLIGPEGDFTGEEISLAKQRGYLPVSLGENRLRTETAGLYACNCFSILA